MYIQGSDGADGVNGDPGPQGPPVSHAFHIRMYTLYAHINRVLADLKGLLDQQESKDLRLVTVLYINKHFVIIKWVYF